MAGLPSHENRDGGGLINTHNPTLAEQIEKEVSSWPRLASRDYRCPAKACLRYDLASSPPLFQSLVFPLIRKRMKKSPAGRGLEHIGVETDEINPTLTSRPSFAAFAEWTPKLDHELPHALHIGAPRLNDSRRHQRGKMLHYL